MSELQQLTPEELADLKRIHAQKAAEYLLVTAELARQMSIAAAWAHDELIKQVEAQRGNELEKRDNDTARITAFVGEYHQLMRTDADPSQIVDLMRRWKEWAAQHGIHEELEEMQYIEGYPAAGGNGTREGGRDDGS